MSNTNFKIKLNFIINNTARKTFLEREVEFTKENKDIYFRGYFQLNFDRNFENIDIS
jgi:hypothetical protein